MGTILFLNIFISFYFLMAIYFVKWRPVLLQFFRLPNNYMKENKKSQLIFLTVEKLIRFWKMYLLRRENKLHKYLIFTCYSTFENILVQNSCRHLKRVTLHPQLRVD